MLWDLNSGERLACRSHFHQTLKIPAGEERVDDSGVVVQIVPKVNNFAVRQEYERRIELLRIGEGLLFGDIGIKRAFLRFNNRERPTVLSIEHIVCEPS